MACYRETFTFTLIVIYSVDTFACYAIKLRLNYSWFSRCCVVLIDRPLEERAYCVSLFSSSLFGNCLGTENGGRKILRNFGKFCLSLRPDILEDPSFQQNPCKNLKSPNIAYVYVSFHKFVKLCLLLKRCTTIGLCAIVSWV